MTAIKYIYNCPLQEVNTDKSGFWDPQGNFFGSHTIKKVLVPVNLWKFHYWLVKKYQMVAELQASQNWILVRLVAQQPLNIFPSTNNETFIDSLELKLFLIVQDPKNFPWGSQNPLLSVFASCSGLFFIFYFGHLEGLQEQNLGYNFALYIKKKCFVVVELHIDKGACNIHFRVTVYIFVII